MKKSVVIIILELIAIIMNFVVLVFVVYGAIINYRVVIKNKGTLPFDNFGYIVFFIILFTILNLIVIMTSLGGKEKHSRVVEH